MIEIDKFLVIFSLEIGGKFIGLFAVISSVVTIILSFFLLVTVSLDKDLHYLRQKLEEIEVSPLNLPDATDEKAVQRFREYWIVSLVLFLIISAIFIIAGYLLVRGTKNVSENVLSLDLNNIFFISILAKPSTNQTREECFGFHSHFQRFRSADEIYNQFIALDHHLCLPLCRDKFSMEKD